MRSSRAFELFPKAILAGFLAVTALSAPARAYDPHRAAQSDVDAVWTQTLEQLAANTRTCIFGYTSHEMRGRAMTGASIDRETIETLALNRCATGYYKNAVAHHFRSDQQARRELLEWAVAAYNAELRKGR